MHLYKEICLYITKKVGFGREHIFAEIGGIRVLKVLRTYRSTRPGRRFLKYRLDQILPEKDVGLDLDRIAGRARARYQIKLVQP
jgi:hypothetical protein